MLIDEQMLTTNFRRKHYLRVGEDLYLDWRPLYRELKLLVLPIDTSSVVTASGSPGRRSSRTLLKMCSFAQLYFDPEEIPAILDEILPYFSTSNPETAFAVVGLLNLLLPTMSVSAKSKWIPQYYLPSLFHIWSLMNRSKSFDLHFLDHFSRLARDTLSVPHVEFTEYGVFTGEQTSLVFTSILRLLEIPVSQVTSPYSGAVDIYVGLAAVLERDQRKHPMAHHIARWVVMGLSPACADAPDSMLSKLEGLIQAVETFFHPSNTGAWSRNLAQLVFYLSDFFVMRWNRERSGEMPVPKERQLNDAVKKRFVLCLREVTFMGIFAKSSTAMSYSLSSLQGLAFLEPTLILPGALQRIYPSMRGLVEVHRTTSSIRALHELTRTLIKTKGFRCHATSLLGLALPGIDANDLDKTMYTLAYMQAFFYNVPMCDLTQERSAAEIEADVPRLDAMVASQWVSAEIERLEGSDLDTEIDYSKELSDEDEAAVVRSSTAEFHNFVVSFLDRVFILLKNLPDPARIKSGSPEENIANTLPAAFTPMFSSMSSELYDLALNKIAGFVSNHVVYQARDATAFICSALCKVDPKKALGILVPIFVRGIRTEIDDNGAGSTRTTGSEVIPRDRALVWNISLLSMSLVHVGNAIMDFEQPLFDLARYMQQKLKGLAATHASNLIHHLLLTLTMTYTVDHSLFEQSEVESVITPAHWSKAPDAQRLNIKWHHADEKEINFAIKLFDTFAKLETERLQELTSESPSIKRDGAGKEWSDEVSRSLVLLRLILSGVSSLFDPRYKSQAEAATGMDVDGHVSGDDSSEGGEVSDEPTDADMGGGDEESLRPAYQYPTGYQLSAGDDNYDMLHHRRIAIGETLHRVHEFLGKQQQDDVISFNALYTAYRSWFADVGIERSAHVLDRVTRLFVADTGHFKVSGLRKDYPRPLLVRRANLYHLQRLRHNASPRHKTELDVILLTDLVHSSISHYTEIRRTAQTAIESTMKVLIGARPTVIPPLLHEFATAIKANDFPKIKGAMFTLLFGSLTKSIGRDWRYTPSLLKSYVDVLDVDKPSVQRVATACAIQIMDMTRLPPRIVILNQDIVERISPDDTVDAAEAHKKIAKRKDAITKKKTFTQKQRVVVSEELGEIARKSHWRKESRAATLVVGLSLRFEDVASQDMVDLVVRRAVDHHPSLRAIYNSALIGLFAYIDTRAIAEHDYENLLLNRRHVPGFISKELETRDLQSTKQFLTQFSQADAQLYLDQDYPGWLVWGRSMPAFEASAPNLLAYDEVESTIRSQIGALLDRAWFLSYFSYMKQEPRDQHHDRFRMTSIISLTSAFNLVLTKQAVATFEDLKELVKEIFGNGQDKHQHRATAEILGALLNAGVPLDVENRSMVWEYVFPIVRSVFEDGLNPENSGYWATFLDFVLQGKDPRRSWPLVEWLASFRLSISSNAAFKESSKITLLDHCITDLGWHFQLGKPVLDDFLSHLDHPYKQVRTVVGQTLASLYRAEYHESHESVEGFIESEKAASSIGSRPYKPSDEFASTMKDVFGRIEKWRKERPAGQQTASSYTSGSKTVVTWLEHALSTFNCTQYTPFFPDLFLEALLHMMDIKEDPELQAHAYSVFRHLGNMPYRSGEEEAFVEALIRIGRTSTSWHQRLRVMINMQAIYFRHLFLMSRKRQKALFDCIAAMLEDSQLEVRVGAQTTLSGMIRCSPVTLRAAIIKDLTKKFTSSLQANPLPRQKTPGTPTPEQSKLALTRHAAVLGLGALVQAFPYTSPPPSWIPAILATLAVKAAGDPGVVGKSAKSIVSDFKKTRQDTWHVDVKV